MVILIKILKAFFSRTERTGKVWSGEGELMTRLLRCESPIVRWEDGRSDDLSYQYILQYISVCNCIYNHQYIYWHGDRLPLWDHLPVYHLTQMISDCILASDSDDILATGKGGLLSKGKSHFPVANLHLKGEIFECHHLLKFKNIRKNIWGGLTKDKNHFLMVAFVELYLRERGIFECHKWWFL